MLNIRMSRTPIEGEEEEEEEGEEEEEIRMLNIRMSRTPVEGSSSTLLFESSWHPTNILDPVTETINNRTKPQIGLQIGLSSTCAWSTIDCGQ